MTDKPTSKYKFPAVWVIIYFAITVVLVAIGVVVVVTSPQEGIRTEVVQDLHKFIRKDIFLANEMTPIFQDEPTIEVLDSITLLIRFSQLDSVSYHVIDKAIYRDDIKLFNQVEVFEVTFLDSTAIEIYMEVGANNPTSYQWIILPWKRQ